MFSGLNKIFNLILDWSKYHGICFQTKIFAAILKVIILPRYWSKYDFQLKKILSETSKNLQCQTMSSNQKHLIQKINILISYNGLCDHTRPFGFQKLKFPSKSNLLLMNFGIIDEKWKNSQFFGQNFCTF